MMLMVLRLYWKPVGQVRAPRPPVPIFLTWKPRAPDAQNFLDLVSNTSTHAARTRT
jgi:hypothetical protein